MLELMATMKMTEITTEAKAGSKVHHLSLIWNSKQSSLLFYDGEESKVSPHLHCSICLAMADEGT